VPPAGQRYCIPCADMVVDRRERLEDAYEAGAITLEALLEATGFSREQAVEAIEE